MPQSTSTGIRNNNYLNVKNGPSPWLDAGGKDSKSDSRSHAVFTDPAYGVRAGIMLLRTYFFTHNLRTIAEILARWAPASDTIGSLPGAPPNSPVEYSNFVAARMGIGVNQTLDIFNADRSVGNVARLRSLFSAMAAFEIGGGFEMPANDFSAGLELLQPGIKAGGTESTVSSVTAAVPVAVAGTPKWKIDGSVGNRDKGAVNAKADVETVQQMLRNAAMILGESAIDPGGLDGKIAKKPKPSTTVDAIKAFQGRFLTKPDGLIEVDGRTWKELILALNTGGTQPSAPPPGPVGGAGKFFFPFSKLSAFNWTSAPRSFAASRSKGKRAHAGCDLYFPKGTTIHAITDGTVIRGPYLFYAGTYAIEVDHGTFVARYGEVQQDALVRTGDRIVAGQAIAKVGHLVGISVESDMLHLELYDKSAHGDLTVSASAGAHTSSGRPFMRRRDLIDPTPKLNVWQNNLPGAPAPLAPAVSPATTGGGIPGTGFCIQLKRIRQEQRASKDFARTVGNYQCFWNGAEIAGLSGQIVERGGPGDNTTAVGDNRNLRIRKGTYRLAIQDGNHYKTYGYLVDGGPSDTPKPGLLLKDTDERFAILLHPGSDYISSVGCLNPALGLTDADSKISFVDSRARVIAIIDEMKKKMGAKFPKSGTIPDAVIIIEGEPK